MHQAFSNTRVRKNREFFELSPQQAISALRLTGGRQIELDDTSELDFEAKEALNKAKKRRERFSFKMVDIEEGEELYFYKETEHGERITCAVKANNSVAYKEEIMSLSASAMKIVTELGYDWVTVSGPACWCYEGETLDERRQRFESE